VHPTPKLFVPEGYKYLGRLFLLNLATNRSVSGCHWLDYFYNCIFKSCPKLGEVTKYLCNSEVFFLYCIPDFGGRAGKIGSFINLPVMSLCE
jgi:hypothetical protein